MADFDVYLPPTADDELHRQLDLEIWGAAYIKAQQKATYRWLSYMRSHPEPEMEAFPNLAVFYKALLGYEKEMERQRHCHLYGIPIAEADQAAIRGTQKSWGTIRRLVWERDRGICQVCGRKLEWGGEYECGHIIDRVVGGSDRPCNLVCMCVVCNQLKPPTKTRQEYIDWASQGGPIEQITQEVFSTMLSGEI